MITSAFTCTGPYAILIMLGIKRVENRSVMPVPSKGRCAVSCSKSFNAAEYGNFVQWASRTLSEEDFDRIPAWADVKDWAGKVVGCCDYAAECRRGALAASDKDDTSYLDAEGIPRLRLAKGNTRQRLWDEGYDCWWNLSEVVCLDRPIPCRGNVGMWQMPSALAAQVAAADSLAQCAGTKITTATDAERLFRLSVPIAGNAEGFFVLPLDADRCALSEPILVSLGDPTTAVVQPGEVLAAALKCGAKAAIVAHNHPRGTLKPSPEDVELTRQLVALANLLGMSLVDHLIITKEGCKSIVSG